MSFDAIVAELKAFREGGFTDAEQDNIRLLQGDERMAEAWGNLQQRITNRFRRLAFLSTILTTKFKADHNHTQPQAATSAEAYFSGLAQSAKMLAKFFEEQPITNIEDEPLEDYLSADNTGEYVFATPLGIREMNANIRELRRTLPWAEQYLSDMRQTAAKHYQTDFPRSQKRSSSHVAFCIMLCQELEALIQTPLYGFVATVTSILYPDAGDISTEQVRKARTRQKSST